MSKCLGTNAVVVKRVQCMFLLTNRNNYLWIILNTPSYLEPCSLRKLCNKLSIFLPKQSQISRTRIWIFRNCFHGIWREKILSLEEEIWYYLLDHILKSQDKVASQEITLLSHILETTYLLPHRTEDPAKFQEPCKENHILTNHRIKVNCAKYVNMVWQANRKIILAWHYKVWLR